MSRADLLPPPAPSLGRALRIAATDFYFNSWRLVAVNLLWGAMFFVLFVVSAIEPPFLVLTPLLALPIVAIFRIAAMVTRGEGASLADGLGASRRLILPALLLGAALVACAAVFLVNMATGLTGGGIVGWSLATLAAWGLVGTWVLGWIAWPLLVDPARMDRPIRARLRIAVLLTVAHPVRMVALSALVAALLAASTVVFAALVSISVAYSALIVTRCVLPAADRLEARLVASADIR